MKEGQIIVWSGQLCCIESWQSTPVPVDWGLLRLDVPGFDCCTLLPVWQRRELAAYTVESIVDILAIQEHHIHFEMEIL